MLSEASVVVPAIEAIRRHHERLDGSGYPGGLKGAAIHLLARIIGVADAFDAMTSARPYRQAMSPATAVTELNRHKDTQFDPACVEAMAEVIASGQLDRQEGQMIAAG
jgi:HD-GYP domain-containing protein (c-di-GMP phosphodiesterase class II)